MHDKGKSSRMADNPNGSEATSETIFTPDLKLNDGFVPSDESIELVKNRFDLSNAIVFYPRKSKFLTEKNANKEMFSEVGQILKKKGFKIFFVPILRIYGMTTIGRILKEYP